MTKKKRWFGVFGLGSLWFLLGCGLSVQPVAQDRPPVYGYRIVNAYPHDPQAFTQGLIYRDGFLYESAGRYGLSSLRKVRLETGEVVQERRIDNQYWAEGLTDWNGRLFQLTWQSNIGFVYDLPSFKLQNTLQYSGEGWGLTHDGSQFIMSDGSDTLRLLDPVKFRERGRILVKDGSMPIRRMNELEYVRGEVYANIWHTNRIARISPVSGGVVGWIDLTNLLSPIYRLDDPEAVLNGIAYDEENDRLFVTGKLWPRLFEIELIRR
jgi:glutaminyl-peptide cyclotransferase